MITLQILQDIVCTSYSYVPFLFFLLDKVSFLYVYISLEVISLKVNFDHSFSHVKNTVYSVRYIQWNLSNPTHQGTREMCPIVQDVRILRFYFS